MKSLKYLSNYAVVSIVPALLIIACAKDANKEVTRVDNGGTTETTSGNVVGTIWNDNGTRAKKVSVRLTPVNFNPYLAGDTVTIDSTQTDENGTYSFSLVSSGFFNVSAQSGQKYCYEDSVFGSEKSQIMVKDDTLKAPGSLSGVAQLRSGDDNRQIIILALGTNTYVSPDSSGAFSIPVLAQGDYLLRILTAEKGFGYLDTMVTVKSGENTAISGIFRLPFDGVPAIGAVGARLDPHTMYVTLSWPRCDTSKVTAFYVFRNTTSAASPFAILKSADTSFTDDVILLNPDSLAFGDTLRYLVAAVGKDRTLGRVGLAPDILLRNYLTPIDTIPLAGVDLMKSHEAFHLEADMNHNVYFNGFTWIWKIDTMGTIIAGYGDSAGLLNYLQSVVFDKNGNVYAYQEWPFQLTKFSPDLKPCAIKAIGDSLGPENFMLATNGNGLLYLFLTHGFQKTCVQTFDSTLSLLQSDTIPEYDTWTPLMHDDTFFITTSNGIKVYDIHLNYLRTLDCDSMINNYYPLSLKGSTPLHHAERQVNFTVNDISLIFFDLGSSGMMDNDHVLLAVDSKNRLIGRRHFSCSTYAFDGIDRVYVYNNSEQSIYIYKIN